MSRHVLRICFKKKCDICDNSFLRQKDMRKDVWKIHFENKCHICTDAFWRNEGVNENERFGEEFEAFLLWSI